jgi:hypothetical protein
MKKKKTYNLYNNFLKKKQLKENILIKAQSQSIRHAKGRLK